jgi:PAS domain S-box-containing protein
MPDITKFSHPKSHSVLPISKTIVNGLFTVDQHWTVQYWNAGAETLLGVLASDIVGKNLWEEFVNVIPLNFYIVYHKAFLQDVPVHFQEYWAEKSAWFDVITYHCDDTLSVSFKNCSRLVDAAHAASPQEQLQILNSLYRFVAEVTNDCLWEWNLQTREIFWIDGGHKRNFGYDIENALIPKRFWESRIHTDDRSRVLSGLAAFITSGSDENWEVEYRFRKANGEYAYVQDRGHLIPAENNRSSRMIGATLDITARKVSEIQLLESQRQKQKEITGAILIAQENERAAIGREMHDNLNQILGAAKLYIEMAKVEPEHWQICLDKSSGYIVDVIQQIRKLSKSLITPVLVMGLIDSIRILIDDLRPINPLIIELKTVGIEESLLDKKLQLDLFRMAQEQVSNILKHSAATRAFIQVSQTARDIILKISDNGRGCGLAKEKSGIGIKNILARADQHGGTVTIVSRPQHGYSTTIVLPVKSIMKNVSITDHPA